MVNNVNTLKAGTVLKSPSLEYVIEEVLGAGGFGVTYRASTVIMLGNLPMKVSVAVKEHFMSKLCGRDGQSSVVYSDPVKGDVESARRDFISEAKRLHKLGTGHHNIVKVNEVFEANNTAYYVMEHLDGTSLNNYVLENGPLSEEETLAIMLPILDAVSYLHSVKITHLDIKPDNIMLTRENGKMRPVLIDFGLSKHYKDDGSPTSKINTLGCSNGYAPMEQYIGITRFTPQADIYALGAVMQFCLSGKDPVNASDQNAERIARALPPSVSNATRSALTNAMKQDKNERTQSVRQFVSQLPVSDSEPTAPSGTGKETKKLKIEENPRPNKRLIAIVATVAVIIGIAIIAFLLMPSSPKQVITEPSQPVEQGEIIIDEPIELTSDKADAEPEPEPAPEVVDNNAAPSVSRIVDELPAPKPASEPAPKPKPQPAVTNGTVSLPYGDWTGGVASGKPHGKGKITFTSARDFHGSKVESGYTLEGSYDNGQLVIGKLYDASGKLMRTIVP